MTIRRFEDLECWQLARELTRKIYSISGKGPFAKDFELRGQIRDAAGSSMHNSAEGFDAGSNPEFVRFLRIAQRSSTEVKSQLYAALDQQDVTQTEFDELFSLAGRVHNALGGLIRYLLGSKKPASGNCPTGPRKSEQPRTKNQEPENP